MRTAILTFEQYLGKANIGSSRIRGRFIWENWKKAGVDLGECEEYKIGQKYDAIIFQKAYWTEFAKDFKGIKILDICDPDWMDWGARVVEMISYCDAVTCSSPALVEYLSRICPNKPVLYIPDRIDLTTLPTPKIHAGDGLKVVWYGYQHNNPALEGAIPSLIKLGLELIVISDKPLTLINSTFVKKLNLTNYSWNMASAYSDIQRGDIVINPQLSTGRWKYKSNNKTTLAWALGMPVAEDVDDLKRFISAEERNKEAEEKRALVIAEYDVLRSVEEIKNLIIKIQNEKLT